MPKYKLSPEERTQEKERKENLRNIMKGLNVKNFDDLKDAFKIMVGEMLEYLAHIKHPGLRTKSWTNKIMIESKNRCPH